ncbi:MAG: acyl--CoA ligase [Kaiparowitsia implicata GSE-PSE-MK54-09C]|jgi:long-chain acyl-CoA synthetase|nr:acyl--CoA ligase [Kaiparowitsia implicata GSE-PSE-MK54-09C]
MSDLVTDYFDRLSRIDGPVLTDARSAELRVVNGGQLPGLLDRLASELAARGVNPGDRILAVFDNTLESALLLLTAMRHGITVCLQPAGASEADLVLAETLCSTAIRIDATGREAGAISLNLDQLPATRRRPPNLSPLTPFTITFTSGSTGEPKGVVHAAESFLSCADSFNRQTGISAADRFLNVMPMYYMAGIFNGILAPLQAGASVVIEAAFDTVTAMRFWQIVRSNAITATWLSPTMLSLAMRLDRTEKTVPHGFRRLFVGTGAMAKADAEAFMQTYGLPPLQSYGLSELLYISVDDPDMPELGSVGRPLAGVGLDLDERGGLAIRSQYAFLGYLSQAGIEPTPPVFVTSDLAKLSNGRLSILGRSDDIILRGGVNINPIELEALLKPLIHPRGFGISSVPDAILGQRVVLVLEGAERSGDADILAEAQRLILGKGGRTRIDVMTHIPVLPLGPTGKVRRSALRSAIPGAAG